MKPSEEMKKATSLAGAEEETFAQKRERPGHLSTPPPEKGRNMTLLKPYIFDLEEREFESDKERFTEGGGCIILQRESGKR